jgi:ABC-type transporter Mla subunit MlaD
MAARTHFKLGLFTLVALAAAVIAALALGARTMGEDSFHYHTYFDETVSGLDIGAPVKYRGVPVGAVAAIKIAPDHRHVDVMYTLRVPELARLGLLSDSGADFTVPSDVRAQIGSQGITGVKLIDLDFFDPATSPVPTLPFTTAERTIPAAPSLMKNIEDSLKRGLAGLPDVLEAAVMLVQRIDGIVADFQDRNLPGRVAKVVDDATAAVADIRRVLRDVDKAKIPAALVSTLDGLSRSLEKVDKILDQVEGEQGLVGSSKRATDAVSDLGRDASSTTEELNKTLRDVAEAAQALRDLSDALERDPDMLLKGRSESKR